MNVEVTTTTTTSAIDFLDNLRAAAEEMRKGLNKIVLSTPPLQAVDEHLTEIESYLSEQINACTELGEEGPDLKPQPETGAAIATVTINKADLAALLDYVHETALDGFAELIDMSPKDCLIDITHTVAEFSKNHHLPLTDLMLGTLDEQPAEAAVIVEQTANIAADTAIPITLKQSDLDELLDAVFEYAQDIRNGLCQIIRPQPMLQPSDEYTNLEDVEQGLVTIMGVVVDFCKEHGMEM